MVRGREDKRTAQTSQTTQSSCVPAIGSLPCSPPERGETELCLRGVRKTERKKQWTGECKHREHKKTSELLPKIKLPLKQKKTQGFIQSKRAKKVHSRWNLKSQESCVSLTTRQWAHSLCIEWTQHNKKKPLWEETGYWNVEKKEKRTVKMRILKSLESFQTFFTQVLFFLNKTFFLNNILFLA